MKSDKSALSVRFFHFLPESHSPRFFLYNVEAASSRFKTRLEASSTLWRRMYNYFDPALPVAHLNGNLPHWRQDGCTYFVTFRLADSLPQVRLMQWMAERKKWLEAHPPPHTNEEKAEFWKLFPARFHRWLDAGHGSCALGDPATRSTMERTLLHFNQSRYRLTEYTVMPNHVHAIVTPLGDNLLSEILHSWKSFSATCINRMIGRSGSLWQKECFDHIVRSSEQLRRIRQYIRNNPKDSEDDDRELP
jgi:REP element-mobilizing transposase RayT